MLYIDKMYINNIYKSILILHVLFICIVISRGVRKQLVKM